MPVPGAAARCFSIWRGGRWPSPSGNGPIKPSTVSTARSALTRPQILADVLGLPVHVPGISESAAAGAAALAGLAIGARPRAAALAGPIPPAAPLAVPAPGQARRYDEPYAEWIRRTKRDK